MNKGIDESLVAVARELTPLVREHALEAEKERRLSATVIEALDRNGLTKMFLPKALGGRETDPLTCMRVIEEIASADAAAGWLLMVANSGAFTFARLPDKTVEGLLADRSHWLTAAAIQPPVEAREVAGGFRLSGRRPFASGVSSARSLMVTALVMDGDQPRMTPAGPHVIIAVLPTSDVEIIDTWYGLGLRGSNSNDVAIKDVFVPSSHTCPMTPAFQPNRHYEGALYRLPIIAAAVGCLIAPIALAVARNALDEVRALSSRRIPMASNVLLRDRGVAQARLGRGEAMLRSARALLYDTMAEMWQRTLAGQTATLQHKADVMLAGAHAAQAGAEVVDMMFTSGGSSAVFDTHPLQKLFRDAQVIRQHGFICAARYETFGQVALGLEPDLVFLHF
jgi:alkylation response protein AidB-like acyl-CoA dehydrogenase